LGLRLSYRGKGAASDIKRREQAVVEAIVDA